MIYINLTNTYKQLISQCIMSNKVRINPMEKINQRSIGFNLRQILFFAEHPEFKPDLYCRIAVDEQIKLIDDKFLEKKNE